MDVVFQLPTPIGLGSSEEHRAVFVRSTLLKEGTIWDLLNWCFSCHLSPWHGAASLKPPGQLGCRNTAVALPQHCLESNALSEGIIQLPVIQGGG